MDWLLSKPVSKFKLSIKVTAEVNIYRIDIFSSLQLPKLQNSNTARNVHSTGFTLSITNLFVCNLLWERKKVHTLPFNWTHQWLTAKKFSNWASSWVVVMVTKQEKNLIEKCCCCFKGNRPEYVPTVKLGYNELGC